MFGIFLSALRSIFGFLISAATIKFVVLSALAFVVSWIIDTVLSTLDISPLEGLQTLLNQLPVGVLWLMGLLRFDVGVPLVLGAMLTRFLIRRLPIIG